MRKIVRPDIRKTPSGTPIAAPISTIFLDGGGVWDKDVATVDGTLAEVVDAEVLKEMGKSLVDFEAIAVLESLTSCDGGFVLTTSTLHRRSGQVSMGISVKLKLVVSQQPTAEFSLQQNVVV